MKVATLRTLLPYRLALAGIRLIFLAVTAAVVLVGLAVADAPRGVVIGATVLTFGCALVGILLTISTMVPLTRAAYRVYGERGSVDLQVRLSVLGVFLSDILPRRR